MNQLLTCDDVFDRLTRGPFQAGDPDADTVDAHLAACHECRTLAEALRPAVNLVHESLAFDPCRDRALPAYHGRLPPAPEPLVVAPSTSKFSSHRPAWQITAALALGLLLGVVWSSSHGAGRGSASVTPLGAGRSLAALDSTKTGSLLPDWFVIPTACRGEGVDGVVTASRRVNDGAAAGVQHCCTECHSARPADVRSLDVSRLQLACAFCHRI